MRQTGEFEERMVEKSARQTKVRSPKRMLDTSTFVRYALSQKHLSQTEMSRKYGLSIVAINQVISGRKDFPFVQECICDELGFPDWESLEKAGIVFSSFSQSLIPLFAVRRQA